MFKKLNILGILQALIRFGLFPLCLIFWVEPCLSDDREVLPDKEKQQDREIQQLFDEGWALLGNMHKNIAVLDQALSLYEKVLTIDPHNDDAYWKMAEAIFKKGEEEEDRERRKGLYRKTIELSNKALELNSQALEAHYWIGCSSARLAEISGVLRSLPLVNQAKEGLLKSINLDPEHRYSILARAVLAAIYTETPWPLRDLDKAKDLAVQAVGMDPNLTIASEKLAKVYSKAKQYDSARKEINRCLSIEHPTYLWDSILYDWPAVKQLLKEIEHK